MSSPEKIEATLNMIKPKNSVKDHKANGDVVGLIIKRFTSRTNLKDLKNDLELLDEVCRCVINTYEPTASKTPELDQENMIVDIMIKLFPELNNENDISKMRLSIKYLLNNNNIQKIATSTKLGKSVVSWLKKKVL